MSAYQQYRAALAVLIEINNQRDYSAAGEAAYWAQAEEVKRLYLQACAESEADE